LGWVYKKTVVLDDDGVLVKVSLGRWVKQVAVEGEFAAGAGIFKAAVGFDPGDNTGPAGSIGIGGSFVKCQDAFFGMDNPNADFVKADWVRMVGRGKVGDGAEFDGAGFGGGEIPKGGGCYGRAK
jgi:hypothetical protein